MDKDTSIQEVKERVKKFCDKREWGEYHDAKELAIGIITEASELLHMFRFKSKEEAEAMFKNEEKRQEINEEVADIFVFTLLFFLNNTFTNFIISFKHNFIYLRINFTSSNFN